jgi:hypothetical protein
MNVWRGYRRMREQMSRLRQSLTTSSAHSSTRVMLQRCVDRLQVIALTNPDDLQVACRILDSIIAKRAAGEDPGNHE